MAASVLAILSLLIPPLSILSAAIVALVTLRRGIWEGAAILLLSGIACGLLALLLVDGIMPVLGVVSMMWLPVWVLGGLLRVNRSLGVTLVTALLLGLLLIAGQYLQSQDPVASWREILAPMVAELVGAQVIDAAHSQALLDLMARWMPGFLALGFVVQSTASLLLARWWQAVLYNPGGFREEFHQLRLPRLIGLLTLAVVLLTLFGIGGSGLAYTAMLLAAGWFLQGLAVVHAVCRQLAASVSWLIAIYVLMLFMLPYATSALAVVGLIDSWVDFRVRLQSRKGSGGTD